MNSYTWKSLCYSDTKAASNLDKSNFLSSKLSSRLSSPSSAALSFTCVLFRTATMHKKGTCLAAVNKVCPERQRTTVVQVPPPNHGSLGYPDGQTVPDFRKSCPVVLPCGCVDSDQEVCASGKASNVLFALVKRRGLASLWHPRFIFDYGSIRDYETYINWDTWYMQTISYIFNWLSHCVCFGKLWYRSVCKIQLDMGSLYSFVFAR